MPISQCDTMSETRFITFKQLFDGKELLDEKLSEYATLRNYSTGSKSQLAKSMMHYCNTTKMMPTQLLEEAYEDQDKNIRMNMRRINGRLTAFKISIRHLAPVTAKNMFNVIIHWYAKNDVQIPEAVRSTDKVTTLKKNRVLLEAEDIRTALNYVTFRDKAIILLQCSSGMGTSELLGITRQEFLDGIDYETYITTLYPVRAKTQQPYITFCSPEATKAVLLWLEEWKGEMLFNLKEDGLLSMYQRINHAMDTHEKGVYGKIRSHNMRKFFNNQMLNNGMPRDLVWFFSGRTENETQKAYIDYKPERLKEMYMEHLKAVSVTEVVRDITDARVQALEKENVELRAMMEKIQQRLGITDKIESSSLPDERKKLYTSVLKEQNKRDMGLPYKELWMPDEEQ